MQYISPSNISISALEGSRNASSSTSPVDKDTPRLRTGTASGSTSPFYSSPFYIPSSADTSQVTRSTWMEPLGSDNSIQDGWIPSCLQSSVAHGGSHGSVQEYHQHHSIPHEKEEEEVVVDQQGDAGPPSISYVSSSDSLDDHHRTLHMPHHIFPRHQASFFSGTAVTTPSAEKERPNNTRSLHASHSPDHRPSRHASSNTHLSSSSSWVTVTTTTNPSTFVTPTHAEDGEPHFRQRNPSTSVGPRAHSTPYASTHASSVSSLALDDHRHYGKASTRRTEEEAEEGPSSASSMRGSTRTLECRKEEDRHAPLTGKRCAPLSSSNRDETLLGRSHPPQGRRWDPHLRANNSAKTSFTTTRKTRVYAHSHPSTEVSSSSFTPSSFRVSTGQATEVEEEEYDEEESEKEEETNNGSEEICARRTVRNDEKEKISKRFLAILKEKDEVIQGLTQHLLESQEESDRLQHTVLALQEVQRTEGKITRVLNVPPSKEQMDEKCEMEWKKEKKGSEASSGRHGSDPNHLPHVDEHHGERGIGKNVKRERECGRTSWISIADKISSSLAVSSHTASSSSAFSFMKQRWETERDGLHEQLAAQERRITRLQLRLQQAEEEGKRKEEVITQLQQELNDVLVAYENVKRERREGEHRLCRQQLVLEHLEKEKEEQALQWKRERKEWRERERKLQHALEATDRQHRQEWNLLKEEVTNLTEEAYEEKEGRERDATKRLLECETKLRQRELTVKTLECELAHMTQKNEELQREWEASREKEQEHRMQWVKQMEQKYESNRIQWETESQQQHQVALQVAEQQMKALTKSLEGTTHTIQELQKELYLKEEEQQRLREATMDRVEAFLREEEQQKDGMLSQMEFWMRNKSEMSQIVEAAEEKKRKAEQHAAFLREINDGLRQSSQEQATRAAEDILEQHRWATEVIGHLQEQFQVVLCNWRKEEAKAADLTSTVELLTHIGEAQKTRLSALENEIIQTKESWKEALSSQWKTLKEKKNVEKKMFEYEQREKKCYHLFHGWQSVLWEMVKCFPTPLAKEKPSSSSFSSPFFIWEDWSKGEAPPLTVPTTEKDEQEMEEAPLSSSDLREDEEEEEEEELEKVPVNTKKEEKSSDAAGHQKGDPASCSSRFLQPTVSTANKCHARGSHINAIPLRCTTLISTTRQLKKMERVTVVPRGVRERSCSALHGREEKSGARRYASHPTYRDARRCLPCIQPVRCGASPWSVHQSSFFPSSSTLLSLPLKTSNHSGSATLHVAALRMHHLLSFLQEGLPALYQHLEETENTLAEKTSALQRSTESCRHHKGQLHRLEAQYAKEWKILQQRYQRGVREAHHRIWSRTAQVCTAHWMQVFERIPQLLAGVLQLLADRLYQKEGEVNVTSSSSTKCLVKEETRRAAMAEDRKGVVGERVPSKGDSIRREMILPLREEEDAMGTRGTCTMSLMILLPEGKKRMNNELGLEWIPHQIDFPLSCSPLTPTEEDLSVPMKCPTLPEKSTEKPGQEEERRAQPVPIDPEWHVSKEVERECDWIVQEVCGIDKGWRSLVAEGIKDIAHSPSTLMIPSAADQSKGILPCPSSSCSYSEALKRRRVVGQENDGLPSSPIQPPSDSLSMGNGRKMRCPQHAVKGKSLEQRKVPLHCVPQEKRTVRDEAELSPGTLGVSSFFSSPTYCTEQLVPAFLSFQWSSRQRGELSRFVKAAVLRYMQEEKPSFFTLFPSTSSSSCVRNPKRKMSHSGEDVRLKCGNTDWNRNSYPSVFTIKDPQEKNTVPMVWTCHRRRRRPWKTRWGGSAANSGFTGSATLQEAGANAGRNMEERKLCAVQEEKIQNEKENESPLPSQEEEVEPEEEVELEEVPLLPSFIHPLLSKKLPFFSSSSLSLSRKDSLEKSFRYRNRKVSNKRKADYTFHKEKEKKSQSQQEEEGEEHEMFRLLCRVVYQLIQTVE